MYENSRIGRESARYLAQLRQGGLSEKYIREQERILGKFGEHCRAHGVNSSSRITTELARSFLLELDGMSVTWQKMVTVTLRGFLRSCKHPAAMELRVKLTGTARTRVRWLTQEQVRRIFDSPMKPAVAVMIHLGLLMGLRMCEILRVRWDEAQHATRSGTLTVHGKGNRPRPVPLHPDAREVLVEYLKLDPPRRRPELLLGFGKSRAEDLLKQFVEDNGLDSFAFHDMRRTAGRMWWEAKDENGRRLVATEVVSEILGHRSTDTTRIYLGIDLTDMSKAMACYRVARVRTSSPFAR